MKPHSHHADEEESDPGPVDRLRSVANGAGGDERGVAWTVQAFLAVLVMMSTLIFAIDAVPTANRQQADQYTREQLRQDASDILRMTTAVDNDKDATLYWEADTTTAGGQGWINAEDDNPSDRYYTNIAGTGHPLEAPIQETIADENVAYNAEVVYENLTENNETTLETQRIVWQGSPGEGAVGATKIVFLYDDDVPENTGGTGCTLREIYEANSDDFSGPSECSDLAFYAPDAQPSTSDDNYNTVKIRLTLWRL